MISNFNFKTLNKRNMPLSDNSHIYFKGENIMNILCSTDDKYVPYCGIMLTSLFESNKDMQIVVYLLTSKLSEDNGKSLQKLADNYNQNIIIINVNQNMLKDCKFQSSERLSIATYYRLLAPVLLPDTVDKVLYLDCDTIVCNSLSPLWNNEPVNTAVGACIDDAFFDDEKYKLLELPREHRYFNAGIMIINLQYWRSHNLLNKCLEVIKEKAGKLLFHDQDVLNCVLSDEIKFLPLRYNLQTGFLYKDYVLHKYSLDIRQQIYEAIASPCIIHYSGGIKPWYLHSTHPYSPFFEKYKKLSQWNNIPSPGPVLKFYYHRFITHLLYGLGLTQQPETYIITKQQP